MKGGWIVMCALALGLAACGYKGNLKSPSQIEQDQAKKEHEAQKKAQREQEAEARQTKPQTSADKE